MADNDKTERNGAHVADNANPEDPYAVQSGYLPEPGPQGLPHLPPVGTETTLPPADSHGPGKEGYVGTDEGKDQGETKNEPEAPAKPATKKVVTKKDDSGK